MASFDLKFRLCDFLLRIRKIGDTLLQESQILSFRPPTKQAHTAFRRKFNMDDSLRSFRRLADEREEG
jgi:hypothetical protein